MEVKMSTSECLSLLEYMCSKIGITMSIDGDYVQGSAFGHELLLHLDYFTYTNDIAEVGDLIVPEMDTGIYLPPFASRTREAGILLQCFVRCIRSFELPQLDLRIENPFFGKTHILSLPYDAAKVTVDLDCPCDISKDVEHKIAAKEHEKSKMPSFYRKASWHVYRKASWHG